MGSEIDTKSILTIFSSSPVLATRDLLPPPGQAPPPPPGEAQPQPRLVRRLPQFYPPRGMAPKIPDDPLLRYSSKDHQEPKDGAPNKPLESKQRYETKGKCHSRHDFLFLIIHNLDNGAEFVLDSHRLREVSTSLHLTMEEFELTLGHPSIVHELMRPHTTITHHSLRFKDTSSERGGRRPTTTKRCRSSYWRRLCEVVREALQGGECFVQQP
ncbi:hypothetical protein Fmac_026442 [Flemingia macrophylla]|uniref:Uncharacterized protein n=1 Tax=Flemingia macrophylla TaxID=520843 RepID=A0ABD1LEW2_9FABA